MNSTTNTVIKATLYVSYSSNSDRILPRWVFSTTHYTSHHCCHSFGTAHTLARTACTSQKWCSWNRTSLYPPTLYRGRSRKETHPGSRNVEFCNRSKVMCIFQFVSNIHCGWDAFYSSNHLVFGLVEPTGTGAGLGADCSCCLFCCSSCCCNTLLASMKLFRLLQNWLMRAL